MKQFVCICLMLLSVISCKSTKEKLSLTGVKWIAESLNGKELKLKERGSEVSIVFNADKKQVNGKAGCNHFFGGYTEDGQSLTFSNMGATKMACPDMDIEVVFFKVLDGTKSFVIKNNKLSLKNDEEVIAVFKAENVEKVDK